MSGADRRRATDGPAPVVFGCAGPRLTDAERRFFAATLPAGFILFGRNCEAPDQVRALVADLRESVGRPDAPVLIDQEGGRVARLGPPHWPAYRPAGDFAALADEDPERAERAVRLNARLIARDLRALGITVDCAPVLDVPVPGSHDIIGDRAFGAEPLLVARLGRAMAEGLLEGGVAPVVKHVPGHGRALADSHHALPVVDAPLEELRSTDFVPFRMLADMPWAMTAHIVYTAVDDERPATTSPRVIETVIRGEIGFDGVLISDDLSMKALGGGLDERARAALDAGCDIVLHCNGDMAEMVAVTQGMRPITEAALDRLSRAAVPACMPELPETERRRAELAALAGGG